MNPDPRICKRWRVVDLVTGESVYVTSPDARSAAAHANLIAVAALIQNIPNPKCKRYTLRLPPSPERAKLLAPNPYFGNLATQIGLYGVSAPTSVIESPKAYYDMLPPPKIA